MTGITDPSQEYFKNGLWGWVTDQWKKLIGDDAGHLQVDVVESGLPTGAATSANQATMITALQLIDDLRAALNSVATDELDVVIDGQTVDVEVKQQTAADLTPGIKGWDGSAWRKLPMLFGYSAQYAETELTADAATGTNTHTFSTVPAGEIWIVDFFVSRSAAATNKLGVLGGFIDGANRDLYLDPSCGAYEMLICPARVVLGEDDYLWATYYECAGGENLLSNAIGYKMKVAE